MDRVKAEQLASSGSALRARLAKMRDSEARARSFLSAGSGSLKGSASGLSQAGSASLGSLPSVEASPVKPLRGSAAQQEPPKPPSLSPVRPSSPAPAAPKAAASSSSSAPAAQASTQAPAQAQPSSPEAQPYSFGTSGLFTQPPKASPPASSSQGQQGAQADTSFGEADAFAAKPAPQVSCLLAELESAGLLDFTGRSQPCGWHCPAALRAI